MIYTYYQQKHTDNNIMNVFEKVVEVLENYVGNLKLLCQENNFVSRSRQTLLPWKD